MKYATLLLSLILITAFSSCSSNEAPSNQDVTQVAQEGTAFKGKIVFNDFEGGFWGIITSDGKKLHGLIPVHLHTKNLPVQGFYLVKGDVISMRMWGKPASFLKLKTL